MSNEEGWSKPENWASHLWMDGLGVNILRNRAQARRDYRTDSWSIMSTGAYAEIVGQPSLWTIFTFHDEELRPFHHGLTEVLDRAHYDTISLIPVHIKLHMKNPAHSSMRFLPKPKQVMTSNGPIPTQESPDGRKQIRESLRLIQDLIYGTRAGDTYGETLAVLQIDADEGALEHAVPYTEKVIITLDVGEHRRWETDKVEVTMQVKTVGPTRVEDPNAATGYRRYRATPARYIDISVDVVQDPNYVLPYAQMPSRRWDLTRQVRLWNPIVHRRNEIRKFMSEFNTALVIIPICTKIP